MEFFFEGIVEGCLVVEAHIEVNRFDIEIRVFQKQPFGFL